MNGRRRWVALVVLAAVVVLSAVRNASAARAAPEELWITYLSDGLRVRARVFWPAGPGPFPGVVYNHDGVSGLSDSTLERGRELAAAGYAVVAPTYRGEDGSEGQVEVAKGEVNDALNALAWLRAQPRADPARIAMVGTSHGALVSLLAASRTSRLRALVFAYGVADIERWYGYLVATRQLGTDALTRRVYGDGPAARPQSFRIRNGRLVADRIAVPTLILQGGKDTLVPPDQARLLQGLLSAAGVPSELRVYPASGHGFLIYRSRELRQHGASSAEYRESVAAWNDMLAFLARQLR